MGGRSIGCLSSRDRNLLGFRRDLLTAAAHGVDQRRRLSVPEQPRPMTCLRTKGRPKVIYYLIEDSDLPDGRGDLVAEPGPEGFVHCCDERQIPHVRKTYFPSNACVVAVVVDPTRLVSETRYEPGSGGETERFAHVYGPIERSAVTEVIAPGPDGQPGCVAIAHRQIRNSHP